MLHKRIPEGEAELVPFWEGEAPAEPPAISSARRNFFGQAGGALAGIALAWLLAEEQAQAGDAPGSESGSSALGAGVLGGVLHHPPKARRVVQLFMSGAASHLDTFDHKPALEKHHGQPSDFGERVEAFQNGLGPWMKSPFAFRPYGQSGKYLSDSVAPLGDCVDDMAFVHNLVGKTGVHSQATFLQATGFQRPGFPGMGAWISYGLGSLNDELPTFVVLPDHRGFASNGPKNWSSAFLPASTQGTTLFPQRELPIADLHARAPYVTRQGDRAGLDLIKSLNRSYQSKRPGDSRLEARIRSYELAARLQISAPEALDLAGEPPHVMRMYGLDRLPQAGKYPDQINAAEEIEYFGRKCLIARRLLERGVRFVQIWSGADNAFPRRNWDSHEDIARDHGPLSLGLATGAAALIRDLKQRGMLDDTIVFWTTEFGRMPSTQGSKGRDHNPFTFTNWLCGGGIRGGVTCGDSDQWGYKPLDRENPTQVYDIHATILHLLGIDHRRLTVRHDGIDRRLTDVHGHLIPELLA